MDDGGEGLLRIAVLYILFVTLGPSKLKPMSLMSTYIMSNMMLMIDILLHRTGDCAALYMSCKSLYARMPTPDVIILSTDDDHADFYTNQEATDHAPYIPGSLPRMVEWGNLTLYSTPDGLSTRRLYTIGGHPYKLKDRCNACPALRCRVFSVRISQCHSSSSSSVYINKYDIVNDIYYALTLDSWSAVESLRQIHDYSRIPYGPNWGYLKVIIGKRGRKRVIYGAEVSKQWSTSSAAIRAHNYYSPWCSKEVDEYINSRIESVFAYLLSITAVDSRPFMGGQAFIDLCTGAYTTVASRT